MISSHGDNVDVLWVSFIIFCHKLLSHGGEFEYFIV